jgi:DNA polymerase I-like protein with 3'-5' exonuclease and polymerase domains
VVAFVHDEVIIEIPESRVYGSTAAEVQEVLVRAIQRVVGDLRVGYSVAIARNWSKESVTIHDARGRLTAWQTQ